MKIITKVKKFAKENLDELNLEHTERVRKIALKLSRKENANKEIIEIAALLHDIAKPKGHVADHHIKGAEMAKELLQNLNADQNLINDVLHCIESHMMQCDLPDAPRPNTIEAKVLFDADMINLISPFGISKMIFLSVKDGKSFMESVDKAKKQTESAYNELQTESGKKMAMRYWKMNRKFFSNF